MIVAVINVPHYGSHVVVWKMKVLETARHGSKCGAITRVMEFESHRSNCGTKCT